MLILEGLAVSHGLAKGSLFLLEAEDEAPAMLTVQDTRAEKKRVDAAINKAIQQLEALYLVVKKNVGADAAAIFEIHSMMLSDDDFIENIYGIIEAEALSAEYAVWSTGLQFAAVFAAAEGVMQERAADVQDLSRRVVCILQGKECGVPLSFDEPVIIGAQELLPSQTVQMDKRNVLAFVCKRGSMNSHASILARSLGIPAVCALGDGFEQLVSGTELIVNGVQGFVASSPSANIVAEYEENVRQLQEEQARLRGLIGLTAKTKDGAVIKLCANVGHSNEADSAMEQDAEGVGLFRSEFLYLESNDFPDEEEQYKAYKNVLQKMQGRQVVVRTLDLGADKQAPYFKLENEENPALGYRAIRICLDRPDIFTVQLRALLRASVHGRLAVMFPMISCEEEVRSAFKLLDSVKKALDDEGVTYAKDIEFGIMIETPAAVVLADRLAGMVDFFSIGTNDLTQYTMAADRMNHRVNYLFEPGAPAVLRMIRHVVNKAHENGIWAGICGESAAAPELIPYYIAMGVDELSMSPHAILKARETVRGLDKKECEALCDEFLV